MQHSFLPNVEDLLSIIEGMHDNVAIVDARGVMLWISPCFERTYGVRAEDVVGRTTYALEENRIFNPSVAALVLKTRRMVTVTEAAADGHYRIVSGIPIYDDEGNVRLVVSYSVDPRYSLQLSDHHERIIRMARDDGRSPEPLPGLVAESRAMRDVLRTVHKVAPVDIALLITGESGVGKNVLARLTHQVSPRCSGPFVEINCAGIPENLLESELFGYEGGAFTGAKTQGKPGRIAQAHGGTLFLDEVGELPLSLQAKLLQVIQEKQIVRLGGTRPLDIDFRLITATNQHLEALVEKKYFRSDLFFRLNVMPLHITPLRHRPEDILPLCACVLDKLALRYHMRKRLSPAVERSLLAYQWPGNVRELHNVLERMAVVSEGGVLTEADLPEHMRCGQPPLAAHLSLPEALERLERHLVQEAYRRHGTTVAVAKALGISQPTAARKIQRHARNGDTGTEKA